MTDNLMRIGAVARRCQVSRSTIRRYEQRGWITPARSWNRYRVFTDADVRRLTRILDGTIDPHVQKEGSRRMTRHCPNKTGTGRPGTEYAGRSRRTPNVRQEAGREVRNERHKDD